MTILDKLGQLSNKDFVLEVTFNDFSGRKCTGVELR